MQLGQNSFQETLKASKIIIGLRYKLLTFKEGGGEGEHRTLVIVQLYEILGSAKSNTRAVGKWWCLGRKLTDN